MSFADRRWLVIAIVLIVSSVVVSFWDSMSIEFGTGTPTILGLQLRTISPALMGIGVVLLLYRWLGSRKPPSN